MPKGTRTDAALVSRAVQMRAGGASFQQVIAETGLTAHTVSRYTGPFSTEGSYKVRLVRALADLNGQAGDVGELVDKMALQEPGMPVIDRHKATHILWSLNKSNLVTFRENGPEKRVADIKLTRRGWTFAGFTRHTMVGSKDHRGEVPRKMEDKTDFRTQPASTSGGPVEYRFATAGPALDQGPSPAAVAYVAVQVEQAATGAAPVVEAPLGPSVGLPEAFPVIWALRQRKSALEHAAKMLEDQGVDDLALAILTRIDDLSPLEREVLALLDRMGVTEEVTR